MQNTVSGNMESEMKWTSPVEFYKELDFTKKTN